MVNYNVFLTGGATEPFVILAAKFSITSGGHLFFFNDTDSVNPIAAFPPGQFIRVEKQSPETEGD